MLLNITVVDWLKLHQAKLIWTAIVILVDIVLYFIFKFIASRIKSKTAKRAESLTQVIRNLISIIMFFLSAIIVLDIWEFDINTITIISAVTALVVGAGAYDLIRDIFNGVSNTFANLYDLDDVIEINGFKGKVVKINLTKTTLLGKNGELKTFNSSKIKELTNFSRTYSSVSIDIVIDYNEDLDDVINILESKLPSLKEEYSQILEGPIINGVEDMDANNIVIRISAKTSPENYMPVERAIRKKVIEIFKEEHIKFGNKWSK